MTPITCRPIAPECLADYLDFFDTRAFTDNPRWASCYCHYPFHDPSRKAWKLHSAADNRAAISQRIEGRAASGWLAYADGRVVGWCNAGPWSLYPMLRDEAEPDAATLGAIWCFVVEPAWRGRGVATALLGAACDGLRDAGCSTVRATPYRSSDDAAANHLGPLRMYLAAGFSIVRDDDEDGTVEVRKALR